MQISASRASTVAWARYAFELGALSALLVPRATRWGRRWVSARAKVPFVSADSVRVAS